MTGDPTSPSAGRYRVKRTEIRAETADMRVVEITLAPGEEVPWHHHSRVDDLFYGLAGTVAVITRAPAAETRLAPGDTTRVPAMRAHRVANAGAGDARFLLVQGPGGYDFVRDPP